MFITITPKHLPERAGTGTCFWCPALLNASTIKTQLPFSPKSSFEGPLTVGGEPQPMTSAEQKIHLLASRGDLLRDQLRPRAAGPFFPFPTHPLAVLFQDNRSTRDFYLRGFDGSSFQRVTSSENAGCALMGSHRRQGDRLPDGHGGSIGDPLSSPSPPGYPGHHSWTSLMEHH